MRAFRLEGRSINCLRMRTVLFAFIVLKTSNKASSYLILITSMAKSDVKFLTCCTSLVELAIKFWKSYILASLFTFLISWLRLAVTLTMNCWLSVILVSNLIIISCAVLKLTVSLINASMLSISYKIELLQRFKGVYNSKALSESRCNVTFINKQA